MIVSNPFFLLLALFALLPWLGPWSGRNRVQNTFRSFIFLALAVALSQPHFETNQTTPHRVLVFDRSPSVTEQSQQQIQNRLTEFSEPSKSHLVVIGNPLDPQQADLFESVTYVAQLSTRGETPLSAAIAHAQSLIPLGEAGSVTIASDSLATRPDDDRAIAALRQREIPIHWIDLETKPRPATPVRVNWDAPLRKGAESRIDVRIVTTAESSSGTVLLMSDGKELAQTNFSGPSQQTVRLSFEPVESGFLEGTVVVQSDSGTTQELAIVLPILAPHQLLYLGDRQTNAAEKLSSMLGPSFDVTTGDPRDAAQIQASLATADLVMLDDQPAETIPSDTEQQIVDAVQSDGLGLVMSGGRASFGGGGWHNRPLETMLPIELVQKEEKRDPSTSLVIVIDTSGSMTGVRVQLAKAVARLAMKRLLPHDKVGIVEFYGAKRWAAPLQPASNAIELQRALNRMDAGGGTVILPALEEAFYGLQNVDTRYKHVLVLTDGGVESGDFESLMRRMAGEGINVSTVLAGGGYHSEFLVNIANWGKGRFYNVPNRFNLPEILLKQPSTTKLPSYRPGTHLVQARGGSGWWGDVDTRSLPPLAGYVESKPRPGSEILLETIAEKHPVLSTWRYGLGRVTTLTTEPLGEGTNPWQAWPDYGTALARILQRSTADTRDPFRFEIEFDGGEMLLHAIRQQPRTTAMPDSRPIARLWDTPLEIKFTRRSPDRFTAQMPMPIQGESLRLETSANTTPMRWKSMVAMSPVASEQHVDPSNGIDATVLVSLSGGQQMSTDADWTTAPTSVPSGKTLVSLSPWLFGLTLLLFLAEIVWRRLPNRGTPDSNDLAASNGLNTNVAVATLLVSLFCFNSQTAHSQVPLNSKVITAANQLIETSLREGVKSGNVAAFFDTAILTEGNLQQSLDWFTESTGDLSEARNRIMAELEVKLAARRGDLQRASDLLSDLLKQDEIAETRLDLQLTQAKFHDALGETDAAKEIYLKLTKANLTEEDQQAVSLRLALMGLIGDAAAEQKSDAKPLIELATKSKDKDFKNRAANVLAVQNQPAEAVKLFTIVGTGTARFRSASRVTEWAIRANDRDKAIATAWEAVESAALKRDRSYALALLVESYRLKEQKKGLETLVEEFKRRNSAGDSMTAEMQKVWIALLRELGRYDDAIALFRATADEVSTFSVEMRRELLELEGEAGNEAQMIATYRELIQQDPDELAWRGGLTQILLERGDNDDAKALWRDYVTQTDRSSVLMNAAQTLGELGLDLLTQKTIERLVDLRVTHGQALLYWADLQQRRGDVEGAEVTLNRIQSFEDIGDDVRAELASSYERIGRQDKAIEVNEAIRANREIVAEDLEMRLAWLYSEIGEEDKALEQWLNLWRKITSIPRRRYVEDRLMTVASRLGTLADIAIDIEEKLADGTADSREAGLLVRIYSRVNDSVAATEISEEYMSQTGKNVVEQLQEKGRIYQICNDYWNYEKVIERLIKVDPEGETEYLRQLALSMLERGKAQEARAVLMNLRDADDGKDSIGGEFEAGVLSLVGMKEEAADAYRKGIATHPDRIESYLLLANLLKENDQTDRAVGMFQYLAENADRDDLFTIAIDGLLNMEAKGKNMQWARRITLERLAGREDKNYLYQLLSDLSAEVNDKSGQIRALENSLAVSGTRRLSVLRECMELSSKIRGGVYYSSSSRGPTNKGNRAFFAFGRRLIGLNELMPPQVFLDLGKAFLDDGDTQSAERTFGMARNLADPRGYQREVAEIFEKAGKIPEALDRYDRLLRTSPSDVPLMARVAKLNESEEKDPIAFRFYQGGINLLLSQTPLTTREAANNSQSTFWSNNRDAYQTYSDQLLLGMIVTIPEDSIDQMLQDQFDHLSADLDQLSEIKLDQQIANNISEAPRIEKRVTLLQQLYSASDRIPELETMDDLLLKQFPEDDTLFRKIAARRLSSGRLDSLRRLLQTPELSEPRQAQIVAMMGQSEPEQASSTLSPIQMWKALLPAWMADDKEAAIKVLRRVNQRSGRAPTSSPSYVIINGRAVRQTTQSLGDINTWMRLAISLGDDGLALQFARSMLNRVHFQNQPQFYAMCRSILPEARFSDLVRYAANAESQDPRRLPNYLWLLAEMPEYLADTTPSDGELLGLIQNGSLRLGYSFPFPVAMKVFPESIRADALAESMDSLTPKTLPMELIRIPFNYDKPIDKATAKVILAAFGDGIDAALQDNYLRYCTYYLPREGTAVKCNENRQLAIDMLDLLAADKVRKREADIAKIANLAKAVTMHQGGDTEQAIELVLATVKPDEQSQDRYVTLARNWAYSQLMPLAPERFLNQLEITGKDGKPTIADLDAQISLLRKVKGDAALKKALEKAVALYPKQTKFSRALVALRPKPKNIFEDIRMGEQRLRELEAQENITDDAQHQSQLNSVRLKLSSSWVSLKHRVNAMKYWTIVDDHKRQSHEAAQKSGAAKPKVPPDDKGDKSKIPASQPAPVAGVAQPVKPAVPAGTLTKPIKLPATGNTTTAASKPPGKATKNKKYVASMTGVKQALDNDDEAGALRAIRSIWRKLPPAVSSPYGSRPTTKRLALSWPVTITDDVKGQSKPASPSEREAAEKAALARSRTRGGLSTFIPTTRVPTKLRPSGWDVLAAEPFALPEMRRIVRANFLYPANVRTVSLGLLKAKRLADGDEATLAAIIEQIHAGQLTKNVLAGFSHIVAEKPELINQTNVSVLDVLMDRLNFNDGGQVASLAPHFARNGQTERAALLYKVAAAFPPTASTTFSKLITQAKQHFQGDQLLLLGEAMFKVAYDRNAALPSILALRLECLDPAKAAELSEQEFASELPIHNANQTRMLITGTAIFSTSGNYELATKCLLTLLRQHGKPLIPKTADPRQFYVTQRSTRPFKVSRQNLIDIFPQPESTPDPSQIAWLAESVMSVNSLRADKSALDEIVCETLLTIANRQIQLHDNESAKATLTLIDDELLANARQHEPLAIDLFRTVGMLDRTVHVQNQMQTDGRLSYVRFGELVRDTNALEGKVKAQAMFKKLVQLSMEDDLLKAGSEISIDDPEFAATLKKLRTQATAAEDEFKKRSEAAAARKAKVIEEAQTEKTTNAKAGVPKLAPLKPGRVIRALPLKKLKKP